MTTTSTATTGQTNRRRRRRTKHTVPPAAFALAPQPTFEPLTLEQWEQVARIHHTALHHQTGGLIPSNITHLAANLYNTPKALEHSTITAALAAGYLRHTHNRAISKGTLIGQSAAYILSNPSSLYGSPELEHRYPDFWRLAGAFFRDESLAALPEQTWLNTFNLHSYAAAHLRITDGFLTSSQALAQMEPGAGTIFDELKFPLLIEHKVITPTDNGFTLNYWPIIETARAVCLGKVTPPRPDKSALPYLVEETAPPHFAPGVSRTLPLDAFGWSLAELVENPV